MVNKIDALARLKNRIKVKREEDMDQRVIVPRAQYDPINYTETRAFAGIGTVYGTIQLNIIGREAEGIVPLSEAENLKKELFHDAHPLSAGNHVKEGILAISGQYNGKFDLHTPQIIDIFPTILDIFNLQSPEYIDGKSLMADKPLVSSTIKAK